jgi:hypothetical protein
MSALSRKKSQRIRTTGRHKSRTKKWVDNIHTYVREGLLLNSELMKYAPKPSAKYPGTICADGDKEKARL